MSVILSIEGNIGSGKSTIIEYLKNNINDNNIIFLQEPVDEWEKIKDNNNNTVLQNFYADQKKYSFAFQMMAYISRLNLLRNTIKENPNKIIITERSLFTDKYVFAKMLFDAENMNEIEYQIYNNWFESFLDLAPISKMIYLKTDPQISFNRISIRNREGENNIPFSYIKNCHLYHNNMYDKIDFEKKIIDCTNDFKDDSTYFKHISKNIIDFVYHNSSSPEICL
jgi:deoxyadenosine/deoxycytidine kinase